MNKSLLDKKFTKRRIRNQIKAISLITKEVLKLNKGTAYNMKSRFIYNYLDDYYTMEIRFFLKRKNIIVGACYISSRKINFKK